jgi:hypothetical protein
LIAPMGVCSCSSQNHPILAFVLLPREIGHVRMKGCWGASAIDKIKKAIAPKVEWLFCNIK